MVVTFLAILELMKNQQIVIEQEHNFDEISYQAILNLHRVSMGKWDRNSISHARFECIVWNKRKILNRTH